MKIKTLTISVMLVFLLFISFYSCLPVKKSEQKKEKPHWMWNPHTLNNKAGVGIAKNHIKGINAQRQLAVQRAVESIAMQIGVKVKSVSQKTEHVKNQRASTQSSSYSVHTVDGKSFSVTVKELWKDPQTEEIYAWVVSD